MDKTDLINLLQREQDRVKTRINRHEDVMSDAEVQGLVRYQDGLVFALRAALTEKFVS